MKRSLGMALSAVSLAACASTGAVQKSSLMLVRPGMTEAEVVQLLGPPGSRSFMGDKVALQYCKKPGLLADSDEYTTLFLSDGRVHGSTTQTQRILTTSCAAYPVVDFGQAPADQTLEVRQR